MPAHPLAEQLARRLPIGARVVDFGCGRGRNAGTLEAAGLEVTEVSDSEAQGARATSDPTPFAAVLATHALLHGTPQSVAERVDAIAQSLEAKGLFFGTFASTRDARYGRGRRVAEETFAPIEGDERGVPHVYYDKTRLLAILSPYFEIESIEEHDVDAVAGTWAHPTARLTDAVHWFVKAARRADQ